MNIPARADANANANASANHSKRQEEEQPKSVQTWRMRHAAEGGGQPMSTEAPHQRGHRLPGYHHHHFTHIAHHQQLTVWAVYPQYNMLTK
jgi:hypothetical protein